MEASIVMTFFLVVGSFVTVLMLRNNVKEVVSDIARRLAVLESVARITSPAIFKEVNEASKGKE